MSSKNNIIIIGGADGKNKISLLKKLLDTNMDLNKLVKVTEIKNFDNTQK